MVGRLFEEISQQTFIIGQGDIEFFLVLEGIKINKFGHQSSHELRHRVIETQNGEENIMSD